MQDTRSPHLLEEPDTSSASLDRVVYEKGIAGVLDGNTRAAAVEDQVVDQHRVAGGGDAGMFLEQESDPVVEPGPGQSRWERLFSSDGGLQ